MEVKPFRRNYTAALIEIWYKASVNAHHFIPVEFWKKNREKMANIYLPNSLTHVAFSDGKISGFVSMVDEYLAALFVKPELQGKGIGTNLLEYVKSSREHIQLRVFKKNVSGVYFYLKHNFVILSEDTNQETAEPEYLMEWKAEPKK